jgi:hypothetical protein
MRDIQSEGDMWKLAEALVAKIPQGLAGFDEIIDQATVAGVAGTLKANTLRLYRDTANRWPADKRVAGVSFSAHREAMNLGPDKVDEQRKLIEDIRKNLSPGETVSVAAVRKAVRIKKGLAPTARAAQVAAATAAGASVSYVQVIDDVKAGSPKLIGAIVSTTPEAELDKLQAGLNKAIAHVEKLRMRAARAKQGAKQPRAASPASPTTPSAPAKGNGQAPSKSQGDLRGL